MNRTKGFSLSWTLIVLALLAAFCLLSYVFLFVPNFKAPSGSFAVKFPCQAKQISTEEPKPGVNLNLFGCEMGEGAKTQSYQVSITQSSNAPKYQNSKDFFDNFLKGMTAKEGTEILSSRDIRIAGHPAREFKLKTVQEGTDVVSNGAIVWRDQQSSLTIMVVGSKVNELSYQLFLRSLKVY